MKRSGKWFDWTCEATSKLIAMRRDGATFAQIGAALGVHSDTANNKYKEIIGKSYVGSSDVVKPPTQAMLERDRRLAAPPRDLTGALMGDPGVGFSALERR
jgi:hypothetical protein